MGFVLMILVFGLSMLVSWRFRSKVKEYSQFSLNSSMTGKDIAEKMLADHGIYDVKVISVEGQLTDHYNPAEKTVNLSHDVFFGNSVISAAVASHECGHAVQHAKAYAWLNFRSALVPVVNIASQWMQWVILAGILTINIFPALLLGGIILFAVTTIFSFITLPVEFDASKRALAWLQSSNITSSQHQNQAQDALKWAAMTYVVAALGSLATLLYYIMMFTGRSRD